MNKPVSLDGALENPAYDPGAFLDWLREVFCVRSDTQLAYALGLSQPMISKIRTKQQIAGDTLIMAVHEATGIPTRAIKARMFKQVQ